EGACVGQGTGGNQLLQPDAILQLRVQGGQEILGGSLLDQLGKASEAVGCFGLAFPVVLGGEAEFGSEAGADQHSHHASTDFLEEFATMRLRHGTPLYGSSDGNHWPLPPITRVRYTNG